MPMAKGTRTPAQPWGRRWTAAMLAVCLVTESCSAGWRRLAPAPPNPLPSDQQVQVWSAGNSQRWHGVRISPDSVSGVPYFKPAKCDSCRLSLPASRVDSIRLGDPDGALGRTIGLLVAIPLFLLWGIGRATGDFGGGSGSE
jgi:hypothetical protein